PIHVQVVREEGGGHRGADGVDVPAASGGAGEGAACGVRGGEKSQYTCKWCGKRAGDVAGLTASRCRRHPAGPGKGWHEPAL
ncbi:MAG: hypothetical protein J6Y19_00205, partial [Kiritimatiellae bacterium]|nr:hypothetical protein [Kiritimatiellia bacterium]